MKKIIRLTESDLTRIVKRVIMEQKFNGKQFFDNYAQKMSNYLKGKTFNTVAYNNNDRMGKGFSPVIKFLSYADRDHTSDDAINPYKITEFDIIFNVQIVKTNGLKNFKDNQKGYVMMTFNYKDGKMVSFKEVILLSSDMKQRVNLQGWTQEDIGGFNQWSFIGKKQTTKYDPKVLELQRNINKYCNKKIKVDGYFGPETRAAANCLSKDLECLLHNGFKETTIGGPMTKRTVLEKEMNGTTYQIGFKNNEEDTKVRVVGNNQNNSEKICDWRCATGTPLGIELIGCKKRRIEYY